MNNSKLLHSTFTNEIIGDNLSELNNDYSNILNDNIKVNNGYSYKAFIMSFIFAIIIVLVTLYYLDKYDYALLFEIYFNLNYLFNKILK